MKVHLLTTNRTPNPPVIKPHRYYQSKLVSMYKVISLWNLVLFAPKRGILLILLICCLTGASQQAGGCQDTQGAAFGTQKQDCAAFLQTEMGKNHGCTWDITKKLCCASHQRLCSAGAASMMGNAALMGWADHHIS